MARSFVILTRVTEYFIRFFPNERYISRSSNTRKRDGFSFGETLIKKMLSTDETSPSRGDRLIKLFVRSTKLASSLSDFFFSLSPFLIFFSFGVSSRQFAIISGRNYRLRNIWIISNGKFNRKRRRTFDETAAIFAIASLACAYQFPKRLSPREIWFIAYKKRRLKCFYRNEILLYRKKKTSITFPLKTNRYR